MNELYLQSLNSLNMEILEVDKIELEDWWSENGICSPYTRIYIPTRGTGYVRIGVNKITLTPGYVYVIPAGVTFSYWREDGFEKIYYHISLRRTGGYDFLENTKDIFVFSLDDRIKEIFNCFPIDSVSKVTKTKSILFSIVNRCFEECGDLDIDKYSDRICEAIAYITKHLHSGLNVEKLADELFISPSKLRKIFKDEMGISIGKYIDDAVLVATEKDVRLDTMPIHEISEKYKFCDQFYFSRCFTKKFGISPRQYRKIHNINRKD